MADCNEKSADDLFGDQIFVKGKFNDLEKLLFAQAEIRDLKKENADQLIDISNLKIELGQLKSFIMDQFIN